MPYKRLTSYLDQNADTVDIPNESTLHTEFCRYLDREYGYGKVSQINTDKTSFEIKGGFDAAFNIANQNLSKFKKLGERQFNFLVQYKISHRKFAPQADGYENWEKPFFSFKIHNDEDKSQCKKLVKELSNLDHVYYLSNSFCKLHYLDDLTVPEHGHAFKLVKVDSSLENHKYFTHRPDVDFGWACSVPENFEANIFPDLRLKAASKFEFIDRIEDALFKTHEIRSGDLRDLIQHVTRNVGLIDMAERMFPVLRNDPRHLGARLTVLSSIMNDIYNMNMIFLEPKNDLIFRVRNHFKGR